jgi:acyl-[acyl-carrier-protein] desaturase
VEPDKPALGLMAYAALQELATRISHRNTGRCSDDPAVDKIMVWVAADENLHTMCYPDIVAAALQVDPHSRGRGDHRGGARLRHARGGHQGFTRKARRMAQAAGPSSDAVRWNAVRNVGARFSRR